MKTLLLFLALMAPAFALDDLRFLEAVKVVENYNGTPGRFGEQGPWQMMPATIRQHGQGSGIWAASAHLTWLRQNLAKHGIALLPFNVALAWNAGLTAVLQGRVPTASYRYADRVAGLYKSLSPVAPHRMISRLGVGVGLFGHGAAGDLLPRGGSDAPQAEGASRGGRRRGIFCAGWVLESVNQNPVVGVGPRCCRPVRALLS